MENISSQQTLQAQQVAQKWRGKVSKDSLCFYKADSHKSQILRKSLP